MKQPDELLPEERDQRYSELITLYKQAPRPAARPLSITQNEQEQIVQRVRERLASTDKVAVLNVPEADQPQQTEDLAPVTEPHAAVPAASVPARRSRGRRFMHMLNICAGALLAGILISVLLQLSIQDDNQSSDTTSLTSAAPVVMRTSANGLDAAMTVTAGPYFVGELLATDLSLTNHTQQTYFLQGTTDAKNMCSAAFTLHLSGGVAAPDKRPVNALNCPPQVTRLAPNQSVRLRLYLPLTRSGHVTLGSGATFTTSADPFAGHWPTMQFDVATQTPADRVMSLQQKGSQLIINAPSDARSQLVYSYTITCQDPQGQGTVQSGNLFWAPLSTTTLPQPGCPGKNPRWSYAVGAPGYAIASGSRP